MNRRDLLKAAAASVAAAGVPVAVSAVDLPVLEGHRQEDKLASPVTCGHPGTVAFAVLKTERPVSAEVAERMAKYWEQGVKGTPLEGVRCFVLSEGVTLTLYDGSGRALNPESEVAAPGAVG